MWHLLESDLAAKAKKEGMGECVARRKGVVVCLPGRRTNRGVMKGNFTVKGKKGKKYRKKFWTGVNNFRIIESVNCQ